MFYAGVGFSAPNDEFQDYEERGFGTWKLYKHEWSKNETSGLPVEYVTELPTKNCFAYVDEFAELSPVAKRLINAQDVRNDLKCVDKTDLFQGSSLLQASSPEYWHS